MIIPVAVSLLAQLGAPAVDIETQNIAVIVRDDGVRITIEADVTAASDVPLYALGAPIESARVDETDVALTDDLDYPGLVQWLPIAGDGTHHVVVTLDGALACDSQIQPGYDACLVSADEFVLLPQEPGASWYLTNLYASDPWTGSVTVTAPTDLTTFAGQGAATARADNGDGTTTSTFAIAHATEMTSVVARRSGLVTVPLASDPARHVLAVVPDEAARTAMTRVAETGAAALPYFEEHFGALGLDEVRYVMTSGNHAFGAMGLLGQVVMRDFIAWPEFDYLVEQGAAHELAHSWWGGLASATDEYAGGFLQEAFAEYSAWRAIGARDGEGARSAGVRMNAVWYLTQIDRDADLGVIDPAVRDDYATYILVTYHKGSTILATLEDAIGADAMDTALSALVARGPGQLSIEHLVEDVEAASGFDAGAFVAQWLEQPGFPTLGVSAHEGGRIGIVSDSGHVIDVPVALVRGDGTTTDAHVHIDGDGALETDGADLVLVDPRWTHVRLVQPAVKGDVSLDGRVDALDLMEIALHAGGAIPPDRRVDGRYDPLYDVDGDGVIDAHDLAAALE